jgi:hypothetical protein
MIIDIIFAKLKIKLIYVMDNVIKIQKMRQGIRL